jgi:autotransporter-associated beta strand protein
VGSSYGLVIGQTVTGTGIAGGTTIAAILDPTHIRLSANATVAANAALTFGSINSLSAISNLLFSGTAGTEATLEMAGSFTRAIGTGAGQVQWTASNSGGFAASSSPLTVNLGGAGASVTWGTATAANTWAIGTGQLFLNSTTALSDVTFVNPINLNGAVRTITVFENTTTTTDFATISGVISGSTGSGLTKAGAGTLYLTGANTYSGNTTLSAGTVIVPSIGGGSTTSSAFGDGSGMLTLSGSSLVYVGDGETAARRIGISASTTIDSSGSGPLVLADFGGITGAARTLTLTGLNTDANTLIKPLVDSGAVLSVTKSGGGTWILPTGSNFTGTLTINGGFLGIPGATPSFAGTIAMANAAIFATNAGGLTVANAVAITANTSAGFAGSNSITLNGAVSGASGNPYTIVNEISGGSLTINGNFTFSETLTARNLSFVGAGTTNFNGIFVTSNSTTAFGPGGLTVNTAGILNWNPAIATNTKVVSSVKASTTSITVASTTGLFGGMLVTGTGIPANTRIAAISGTTITLSNAATDSLTNDLTFIPAITNSSILSQGLLVNKTQSSVSLGLGAFNLNGGSLQSTVDLTGSNAQLTGIQPFNNYGIISGPARSNSPAIRAWASACRTMALIAACSMT